MGQKLRRFLLLLGGGVFVCVSGCMPPSRGLVHKTVPPPVTENRTDCPKPPLGAKVDEKGCELDNDQDGVVNSRDRCPDSILGEVVDAIGCTSRIKNDQDHDGVLDDADLCSSTPSGVAVDANGCYKPGYTLTRLKQVGQCLSSKAEQKGCAFSEAIPLQGLEFDSGSDHIRPESEGVLDTIANLLKRYPQIAVEIAGYSDNQGSVTSNIALSKKRAESTSYALIRRGVAAARLITKGYGPEKPIADNSTSKGRAINRRIELSILGR